MQKAASEHNRGTVRRVAHVIANSASMVGAERLSRMALDIERLTLAEVPDFQALEERVGVLAEVAEELGAEIDRRLGS
jgi:HPt (histidine-containing phosphotransfer) domain-containing protein